MVELIEESKKQPPYRRSWKNFKNLKRPASMEWAENFQKTNQMFQYVLSSVAVMRSSTLLHHLRFGQVQQTRILHASPPEELKTNIGHRALVQGKTRKRRASEPIPSFASSMPRSNWRRTSRMP
jgi:hypothetical protein